MLRWKLLPFVTVVSLLLQNMASASPPTEELICTTAPRSAWMSEERIRDIFRASTYTLVKLKISSSNCYEFYAVDVNGDAVEAYYNPVTGERVRFNEVRVKEKQLDYTKEVHPTAAN